MIVLNEVKYAEEVLKTGKIEKKSSFTVSLLAKYYRQIKNLSVKDTYNLIDSFMTTNYPYYNKVKWENILKAIIGTADKHKIRQLEKIEITRAEVEKIKEIDSEPKQRLMFTLLCFAKLFDQVSESNNGWTNVPANEAFSIARVSTKNSDDKDYMIHELYEMGYLEFARGNTNLNLRIPFVNNDSEVEIVIFTMEELGYEWQNYCSKYKFGRCLECGKLFKIGKDTNRKYCKDHERYQKANIKEVICIDCGKTIFVNPNNTKTCRCEECQREAHKIIDAEYRRTKRLEEACRLSL